MNKWAVLQIVGVAALVIGAQGAIRVVIDHSNRGLTAWMPGGYGGALAADLVLIVGGCALAWFGDTGRRTTNKS